MSIPPGTHLGPYELIAPIGAGGMGEVYRGRDTRLDRDVAIKILPAEFAGNEQLKLRFEREAKTISQLNHPHICTLYDIGHDNGREFLVMELLEGETLADRVAHGPLPVPEVLKYGIQIADALDKAHRQGIVHRDLKPGNIMITKGGVKLLDFGLAKGTAPVAMISEGITNLPTAHKPLTQEGTIVGTFQYMAPEQLEGAQADPRSDIFAYGALLYEMTTGRRAFDGKSRASLIAAIVSSQPQPVSAIQPLAPPALDHIIRTCLEKDPDERWQSAHDIAEELRWISEAGSQAGVAAPLALRRKTRERWLVAGVVAAVVVAAVSAWGWWKASGQERPIARLGIPLPPNSVLSGPSMPNLAISPDGKRVIFSAFGDREQLYLRSLDRFDSVPIPGTEGGEGPFFSPDGEWVAFSTPGALKKIRLSGGVPQTLITVGGTSRGGSWSRDGFIYYSPGPSAGLWRVSATDPQSQELTKPDASRGENSHRWPQVLPDGKHVLFTIRTDRITSFDEAKIAVLSLETRQWRTILDGGSHARYLPTGHLVFSQRGALFAARFDLDSMTVSGSPVPVIQGVLTDGSSGAAQYAVSEQSGTVIYFPGGAQPPRTILRTVDRSGRQQGTAVVGQRVSAFRVSPDQKRLGMQVAAANDDIWTYELERGTLTRVSFEPGDEWYPTWSIHGDRVVFGSSRGLFWQATDGSGVVEELAKGSIVRTPSCSPDGRLIAYALAETSGGPDLWLVSLDDRKSRPLLKTPYAEFEPAFSPDSNWIAYVSNASGSFEVYLRPIRGGGQWQISTDRGYTPRWSRDGRELFYRSGDDFFAVSITLGDTPVVGKPRLLFTLPQIYSYDVFNDGFLMAEFPNEITRVSSIHVVLEWFRDLRARTGG